MHKNPLTYDQVLQRFYSLLMIVLLIWLTVSTPFVYEVQQDAAIAQGITEEEAANPFSQTIEEKAEGSANTLSEYLHEAHQCLRSFSFIVSKYKCYPGVVYAAFHPELLSPPPEGLL